MHRYNTSSTVRVHDMLVVDTTPANPGSVVPQVSGYLDIRGYILGEHVSLS